MNQSIKYRFKLSNVAGQNDCHISGRLTAFSIIQALGQALALWPFKEPVLEASFDYCGMVEETPADTVTRLEFEED
jgi:hypothetical protein